MSRDGTQSMLNLNDCAEGDEAELRAIARLTGPVDVLLTQFSYAAWKGGRANAHFRTARRARKLETIAAQVRALQPRHVVPFASFVYFSNEENSYLNDHINRPADAAAAIAAAGAAPLILYPGRDLDRGHAARQRRRRCAAFAQAYDDAAPPCRCGRPATACRSGGSNANSPPTASASSAELAPADQPAAARSRCSAPSIRSPSGSPISARRSASRSSMASGCIRPRPSTSRCIPARSPSSSTIRSDSTR